LAFANSAGYIMDFNAHRAALQRVADKIAITTGPDGRMRWVRDELYWPTL
jgi:diaminopimelate decarboxylase